MKHSHEEEENYDNIYYLVALISGLFTGAVTGGGIIWTLAGGIVGLLFTAMFLKLLVKGRENA